MCTAAPEVYTTVPPEPSASKPGQLPRWQVEEYFDQGFLIIPNFFTPSELEPVTKVGGSHDNHSVTPST